MINKIVIKAAFVSLCMCINLHAMRDIDTVQKQLDIAVKNAEASPAGRTKNALLQQAEILRKELARLEALAGGGQQPQPKPQPQQQPQQRQPQATPLGQQWYDYLANIRDNTRELDKLEEGLRQFEQNIKGKGYDLTGLEDFEASVRAQINAQKRRSTGGGAPAGKKLNEQQIGQWQGVLNAIPTLDEKQAKQYLVNYQQWVDRGYDIEGAAPGVKKALEDHVANFRARPPLPTRGDDVDNALQEVEGALNKVMRIGNQQVNQKIQAIANRY